MSKVLELSKNVKEIKFEGAWGELESKKNVWRDNDSFISESYKTNLIFTLLFRCFTICSDMQSFHLEVEQLRQIFKCYNYPVGLIDQCVKLF